MIVIYPFAADLDLLGRAAVPLGLELVRAESFRCGGQFRQSQECPPGFDPSWKPERVLRLNALFAKYCSRPPHEAGVWLLDKQTVLIWDDFKDGFGLSGHLGPAGENLRRSYSLETVRSWSARHGATVPNVELRADRTLVCWMAGREEPVLLIHPDGTVSSPSAELRELLGSET